MGDVKVINNFLEPVPVSIMDLEGSAIDETNPINITNSRKNLEGKGKTAVGTTPIEVQITASPTFTIIITADKDNDGLLFIGKSDVLSDGSNAITFLERGDSVSLDYKDVDNALYVVSDTASQNVWVGALL